jgi:hypothetical protein
MCADSGSKNFKFCSIYHFMRKLRELRFSRLWVWRWQTAFWDTVPCSSVEIDLHFRRVHCLHHQGTLMMEAVCISERYVYFNETTRYYIPESCHLQTEGNVNQATLFINSEKKKHEYIHSFNCLELSVCQLFASCVYCNLWILSNCCVCSMVCAAQTLRWWVWIPPKAWMFACIFLCRVVLCR